MKRTWKKEFVASHEGPPPGFSIHFREDEALGLEERRIELSGAIAVENKDALMEAVIAVINGDYQRTIRPGQIWRDNGWRGSNGNKDRLFRVLTVGEKTARIVNLDPDEKKQRRTTVSFKALQASRYERVR